MLKRIFQAKLFVGFILFASIQNVAIADKTPSLTPSEEADSMIAALYARSDKLEKHVADEIKRSGGDKKTLTLLEKDVASALSDEQQLVTHQTVLSLLDAWLALDTKSFSAAPKAGRAKSKVIDYSQGRRFIETVLPLLTNNNRLKVTLMQREGDLFMQEGRLSDAAEKYGSTIHFMSSSHTLDASDIMLLRKSLTLVAALHKSKYGDRAELLLISVSFYPYYAGADEKARAPFEAIYIESGRQLIAFYAGNLKRLQGLSFSRIALKELGPELQRAIVAAGGKATEADIERENFLPNGIEKIMRGDFS